MNLDAKDMKAFKEAVSREDLTEREGETLKLIDKLTAKAKAEAYEALLTNSLIKPEGAKAVYERMQQHKEHYEQR